MVGGSRRLDHQKVIPAFRLCYGSISMGSSDQSPSQLSGPHPLAAWAASLAFHLVVLLLLGLLADSPRLGLGNSTDPGGTAGGHQGETDSGDEGGDGEVPLAMVVHRIDPQDWQAAGQNDQPQPPTPTPTPTDSTSPQATATDRGTTSGDTTSGGGDTTAAASGVTAPIDLDGVLQQLLAAAEPSEGDLTGSSGSSGGGGAGSGDPLSSLRGAVPGAAVAASPGSADRGIGSAVASGSGPASLFGVEGSGSRVVYVVDRSDSMNDLQGRPLAAAKAELIRSLGALESMQFFQLVLYNNQPAPYRNPFAGGTIQMVQGDERAIQRAQSYIQSFGAFGGTDHMAALRMAIRMNPDVIFFLSDGLVPGLTDQEHQQINRLASSRGVTIHCIEFGTDPAPHPASFMPHLAADNRGQYRYLDVTRFTADGDWQAAVHAP